jgi:hypothetical protein
VGDPGVYNFVTIVLTEFNVFFVVFGEGNFRVFVNELQNRPEIILTFDEAIDFLESFRRENLAVVSGEGDHGFGGVSGLNVV